MFKNIQPNNVGTLTIICNECKALMWLKEKSEGTVENPKFSLCCSKGNYKLAPIPEPPIELRELYEDYTTKIGTYFHDHLRALNCALSMAWLDCDIQHFKKGLSVFKIHGMVHCKIGSLTPPDGKKHAFAQIYILDPKEQTNLRCKLNNLSGKKNKNLQYAKTVLSKLQKMLVKKNQLIKIFRNAFELSKNQKIPNVEILLQKNVKNVATRTYKLPTTADEVAAIIPTPRKSEKPQNRAVTIHYKKGGLHRIDETHCLYDPLQYVLFHPFATLGYPEGVIYTKSKFVFYIIFTSLSQNHLLCKIKGHITLMDYYSYRLFTRSNEFNILHRGGRLFQQYCVDMYAKVLQYKLNYFTTEEGQKQIRADLYSGLRDALNTENDITNTGKKVILPASVTYTPRWYTEKYHDAMAIIAYYGKPDLFLTFTCNSKWPEIISALLPGQTAIDRPDLVVRVFKMKLDELMHDLKEKQVLGKVVAYMYTIEFQKRGLPHAHILLILHPDFKMRCPDDFDKVVTAEIPNPNTQNDLYKLVLNCMIHKPCGRRSKQPCMRDGYCKANFPKEFCYHTISTEDGYPKYRRRSPKYGGNTGKIYVRGKGKITVENKWVVPYNPYLLKKYQAHLNVEICSSIMAIKYLYKYIYKGHDKASFALGKQMELNEVKRYFDALYIGANEACWKLFGFRMHDRYPVVEQLNVHLPEKNKVYYNPNNLINNEEKMFLLEKAKKTKLTEWMTNNKNERLNPLSTTELRTDSNGKINPRGPDLFYWQYSTFYTWNNITKKWNRRKNDLKCIGRMWRVSPTAGPKYYLILLLLHVKGAESFEQLKQYPENGPIHPTFKAACIARCLLRNDKEWSRCLQDVAQWQT